MSYNGIETCEVCGSKSFVYTEFKELLQENHCLNEDCGFFDLSKKTTFYDIFLLWEQKRYTNATPIPGQKIFKLIFS
mgnify:CR=1 FL=1